MLSNCKTTIQYLCCSNSRERLSVCQMSHFILKCINRCSALLVSDMQMSCIYFANKELFIYGVITFGGYLDPPPSPLSSRHSIHQVAEYHLFSSDALSMYRFDMTLEMYPPWNIPPPPLCHHVITCHLLADPPPPPQVMTSFKKSL